MDKPVAARPPEAALVEQVVDRIVAYPEEDRCLIFCGCEWHGVVFGSAISLGVKTGPSGHSRFCESIAPGPRRIGTFPTKFAFASKSLSIRPLTLRIWIKFACRQG